MTALHVLFKVGDAEYALAADHVVQMESFTGATKVPGTAEHLAGLMQVRGRVVPVIDLRARFGLPPREPTIDSRVLVVQAGDRPVALLVDSAREVARIGDDERRPAPELVADQGHGYVTEVARAKGRLLLLIDYRKVVGET